MPILAERNQVAIKVETVIGTAEVLAAIDVLLTTELPVWTPEPEPIERAAMSASLSPTGVVIGSRSARIAFKMYLRGASVFFADPGTLPDFDIPFQGCAVVGVESGGSGTEVMTYTPSSALASGLDSVNPPSPETPYCTVALYNDGKQYLIHGATGTMTWTAAKGRPVLFEFDFLGVYNVPTDVALLSGVTYPTVVEQPFLNASPTVLGFANARFDTLSLDVANNLVMRPDPGGASAFFTSQITTRKPSGSIDPEEELAATKNWHAEMLAGTEGAITTGVVGATQYNRYNISAASAQYTGAPIGNRDGIATVPIPFSCNRSSDAGDNEFSLVMT